MVCIFCWVLSVLYPEGLFHMQDGTSDCSLSQCSIAFPGESSGSDSHGKNPKHENFLLFSESVLVKVTASNGLVVCFPSTPGSGFIVVCSSCNCSLTGSRCSSEVSHKLIALGSGVDSKCFGICLGKRKRKIEVSLSSFLCQSCERASATLFCFPADH